MERKGFSSAYQDINEVMDIYQNIDDPNSKVPSKFFLNISSEKESSSRPKKSNETKTYGAKTQKC